MQVIIPMTGLGSRFKAAGYKDLKPFINVCGKPMIEWIVSMYPKDTQFYFIIRTEIRENPKYAQIIGSLAKNYKVYECSDDVWEKKGPVYDVLKFPYENDSIIINYCDFFCLWDAEDFEKKAKSLKVDGAIPCYTGFHPHLIPIKNVYASCKTNGYLLEEIREKYSFEEDKTKAHHSPGIYWFKNVDIMREYCSRLVDHKTMLNGEYYASLVYNEMVNDNKRVWVPDNVPYFCQWGTPEDLKEFEMWMSILNGGKK